MSKIYVTTYEVIGDGNPIAEAHYRAVDEARDAQWKHVVDLGAEGFRPDHNGGVMSLFFRELPTGWRKRATVDSRIEAVPNRSTKAGAAAAKLLAALPNAPQPHELAKAFGYCPAELALDRERGTIFFPTELRVAHPAERIFLRLPRFAADGFQMDGNLLREIPESELMRAVEAHNAEAARLRAQEGGAA